MKKQQRLTASLCKKVPQNVFALIDASTHAHKAWALLLALHREIKLSSNVLTRLGIKTKFSAQKISTCCK